MASMIIVWFNILSIPPILLKLSIYLSNNNLALKALFSFLHISIKSLFDGGMSKTGIFNKK